ncbi:hypothetical protein M426DRAFT_175811 [Hypoxylon sp. CI-4A]|nr:hypothetical protein M426DRAFT_175811 [Hypoxylon sp. CI-4A]
MTTIPPNLKPPIPTVMAPSQPPPLLLTIRFSTALPDLELDIPRPNATTVISLKHTIRQRLAEPNSQRRIRFIHGGKILPDTAVLSSVLRPPPPPPPPSSSSYAGASKGRTATGKDQESGSGKGKSVLGRPDLQRIYVNCSIGDSLTTAELEAEAAAAALPPPPPPPPLSTTLPGSHAQQPNNATGTSAHHRGTTTAPPRGFDRFLSAGFSAAEVNQLRLQFQSIHSPRFTPDTLPSPDTFRRMEDAWIDDNNTNNNGASTMPSGNTSTTQLSGNGTDSDEVGLAALADVMIRGVLTGFLWPLGSAGWLIREEGMASMRWRFMVGVGVLFSLLIGIIRSISADDK